MQDQLGLHKNVRLSLYINFILTLFVTRSKYDYISYFKIIKKKLMLNNVTFVFYDF